MPTYKKDASSFLHLVGLIGFSGGSGVAPQKLPSTGGFWVVSESFILSRPWPFYTPIVGSVTNNKLKGIPKKVTKNCQAVIWQTDLCACDSFLCILSLFGWCVIWLSKNLKVAPDLKTKGMLLLQGFTLKDSGESTSFHRDNIHLQLLSCYPSGCKDAGLVLMRICAKACLPAQQCWKISPKLPLDIYNSGTFHQQFLKEFLSFVPVLWKSGVSSPGYVRQIAKNVFIKKRNMHI